MNASRRDVLLLILVLLLGSGFLLTAAAARNFVGPDEPRYAAIARELARSDDLLVLTLDGKLYAEKPPLWYLAAAASGRLLGGFTDFSSRLPSVVASAALLALTALLGRLLLGDLRTGALAAALLALTAQVANVGPRAYLDPMLSFFTTASAFVFLRGLLAGRAGLRAHAAGWALLGLGMLVKGPPALLPPLLAVAALALVRRDARTFVRIAPLRGFGVALAVVALWLVPWGASVGWDEVGRIFGDQIVGRTVGSRAHVGPPWFYLEHVPVQLLPWTLLVPMVILTWRRGAAGDEGGRRILLAWIALGFVTFSLFSGKRPIYLLPFYPFACLLVADHLVRAPALGRAGRVSLVLAALVPAVVGAGAAVLAGLGSVTAVATLGGGMVVSGGALLLLGRGAPARAAVLAVVGALAVAVPAAVALGPVSDAERSARDLAAAARRHIGPGDVLVRLDTGDRALPWYTDRRWRWADDAERLEKLRRSGTLLLAGEEKDLRRIPGVTILETAGYDGETWAIGRLE